MVAMTGEELQKWVEHTSDSWKKLLSDNTEILSFPCDIRETKSVAELLQHIVAVELVGLSRACRRAGTIPRSEARPATEQGLSRAFAESTIGERKS